MKVVITKGKIEVINEHNILRRSLLRFIARKGKKQKICYHDSDDNNNDYCSYLPQEHTIKDIKKSIRVYKSEWKQSSYYAKTGFSVSQLKEKGWTDGAIKNFLGDCDYSIKNPHYSSAAPMRFYHAVRVLKAEKSLAWLKWYENTIDNRIKQSEAAKSRASKQRQELLNLFENIQLTIPKHSKKELISRAVTHYNSHNFYLGKDSSITNIDDCDNDFLYRIAVNYLRHKFNNYDKQLERISGKIGNKDAYVLFKCRLLDKIKQVYPYLKLEVERQEDSTIERIHL